MSEPKMFIIDANRQPRAVEKIKKGNLKCPRCEIELEVTNFLVKAFLSGEFKYDCPDCGHSWKSVEKVEKKNPVRELKHKPFERLAAWKSDPS